jgi:hypothetical protein
MHIAEIIIVMVTQEVMLLVLMQIPETIMTHLAQQTQEATTKMLVLVQTLETVIKMFVQQIVPTDKETT